MNQERSTRATEPIDPDTGSPTSGPGRARLAVLLAIACGGALGAPARYGLSLAAHVAPGTFPWATFWINVSGSFALGALVTLVVERWPPTRYIRPFAAIGFLGAYTTFSTFAVETDLLIKGGYTEIAAAYVVMSLGAGLAAVHLGIGLARRWPANRRSTR